MDKLRCIGRMHLNKFIRSTCCLHLAGCLLRLRNSLIPKLESVISSRST
jgi:hypothetical protein